MFKLYVEYNIDKHAYMLLCLIIGKFNAFDKIIIGGVAHYVFCLSIGFDCV